MEMVCISTCSVSAITISTTHCHLFVLHKIKTKKQFTFLENCFYNKATFQTERKQFLHTHTHTHSKLRRQMAFHGTPCNKMTSD